MDKVTEQMKGSQQPGDAKNTAKKFTDQGQGKVDELKQKGQEATQSVKDAASNVTGSVPGGQKEHGIVAKFYNFPSHCLACTDTRAPAPPAVAETSWTTHRRYLRSGIINISCIFVLNRKSFNSSSSSRSGGVWSSNGLPPAGSLSLFGLFFFSFSAPWSSSLSAGEDRAVLKDDADETNASTGLLAASESSPSWSVIDEGVAASADGAEVGDVAFVVLGAARRPVVCIIEPSLRESINVDCTPGRDVR
ncbi:uncharacterized protein ARB_03617 [Trichophyton benhamiae CBS 112371]|uniref:Uncharacterized protein n=1 Tax=Arthroderma benhamiae (strain ATCC MYA-4681 / CBS 112371) TaxID=663331 RepID=D4B554_ARTBC|nr:uncharacterized protein ARB_03617 [Trichophyton benhamiae CBS 112371]EFE29539.1 hypothetical protein ARB_03617 [Trichophyton benhamiae CBS 112371]